MSIDLKFILKQQPVMFNTFRSQILLYMTLAMLVSSAIIVIFTYYSVKSDVQKREQKIINNTSHFINLVIKNEFNSLLEYKSNTIRYKKRILKYLVDFIIHLYDSSSDQPFDFWPEKLEKDWMIINREGNVMDSSSLYFKGKNITSFINLQEKSIFKKVGNEYLSHLGEFVVFEDTKKENTFLGFFKKLDERQGTVIAAFKNINFLKKDEEYKKEMIIQKIKKNLDSIKIAESGFVFIFDKNKNMLISPTKENFCEIDANKKYLEQFMEEERVAFEVPSSKEKFSVYTTPFKGFDWYISIALPTKELVEPAHGFAIKLILIIISVFILCIVFSIYLITKATKPLETLSRTMKKVSDYNFKKEDYSELTHDLPISINNEIGLLSLNFAVMIKNLSDNIKRLAENERIEGELKAARDIQLGILPKKFSFEPPKKSLDIYADLIPAREIGGDLYDFFFIDDEHLCFTVGDVAGKGVPAALFMVIAKKLISCNAHRGKLNFSPGEIMTQLNEIIYKDNHSSTFITLFIGILNITKGEMCYANGGHVPPIFVDYGSEPCYRKDLSGPVVGVIPGIRYKDITTTLQPGGAVFLCTDGVTEAMDADEKLFGDSRLLSDFAKLKDKACKEVVDGILYEVKTHAGDTLQSDDIAMLMVRWGSNSHE